MADPPSCSACGRTPSEGAQFCGGCGSALPRRCSHCPHLNPADNLFCESCGQRLDGAAVSRPAGASERAGARRYVTVMFCDLVGSTALSAALDPEEMRRVIQGYQARCLEVITAYDGSVAQFLGDGILAYFGYPAAHEDDAADAVRAGLGITRAMAPLAEELGVERLEARVGLHTGLVVVGELVGPSDAPFGADVLAIGETPNIAARLQSLAQPGEVVIGESTAELVRGYFELESLGYPALKGAGRPIEVLRVTTETSARNRLDVMLGRGLIAMVGRDRELGHLESAWRAAQHGADSVILIDGEPGIGKSRLLLELMERVVASSSPVVDLRCSPRHANSVLYPVVDLLQRILAPVDLGDSEGLLDRVERLVVASGLELADGVPVVAALVGLALPERYPPLPTAPEVLKERTRSLVTRLILGRSRRGLLLLVEDVQWLDPTSQELIDDLLEAAADSGVLAVLTRRSGTSPDWPPEPDVTFTLGRLDESAIRAMVGEIAGGDSERERLVREVVARTDGVPLYVEELTAMLLELSADPDAADQPVGPVVPSTLRDLLMARLDGIGTAAEVARLASCVGREVPYGFLRLLWNHDEALLDGHLRHLLESGLMRLRGDGPDRAYLFKHALVQEVAYDTLLKSDRLRHHLAIAEAMEAAADSVAQAPEVLAHHFADAGLPARAVPYALASGLHAIEQSADREAVVHLQTCLDLVQSLPPSEDRDRLELTVLVHLGAPMMSTRGYGSVEVEEVYRRALELGDSLGDPQPLFEALYGIYRMHLLRAEYPVAHGISERPAGAGRAVRPTGAARGGAAGRRQRRGLPWRRPRPRPGAPLHGRAPRRQRGARSVATGPGAQRRGRPGDRLPGVRRLGALAARRPGRSPCDERRRHRPGRPARPPLHDRPRGLLRPVAAPVRPRGRRRGDPGRGRLGLRHRPGVRLLGGVDRADARVGARAHRRAGRGHRDDGAGPGRLAGDGLAARHQLLPDAPGRRTGAGGPHGAGDRDPGGVRGVRTRVRRALLAAGDLPLARLAACAVRP